MFILHVQRIHLPYLPVQELTYSAFLPGVIREVSNLFSQSKADFHTNFHLCSLLKDLDPGILLLTSSYNINYSLLARLLLLVYGKLLSFNYYNIILHILEKAFFHCLLPFQQNSSTNFLLYAQSISSHSLSNSPEPGPQAALPPLPDSSLQSNDQFQIPILPDSPAIERLDQPFFLEILPSPDFQVVVSQFFLLASASFSVSLTGLPSHVPRVLI